MLFLLRGDDDQKTTKIFRNRIGTMPLRWKVNFCEDKVNLKLGRIESAGWIRNKKIREREERFMVHSHLSPSETLAIILDYNI